MLTSKVFNTIWDFFLTLFVTILRRNVASSFHLKRSGTLKSAEKAFVAGFRPRPSWGLTTLRRPSSRLGRGQPFPNPHFLNAFGCSISAPHFGEAPPNVFLHTALSVTEQLYTHTQQFLQLLSINEMVYIKLCEMLTRDNMTLSKYHRTGRYNYFKYGEFVIPTLYDWY